ncbi:unnamed protein product [Adineta steineri]|uniref:CABIT domain-containing protein n=1 Tax=Adineta steineri TaxID=433720 RepID=A0A814CQA6_9BILA|nr:unnamed protein product [Adineta steineri]CAF1203001.1 unnamed protein product [Adineta steineri]CAF1233546.1 unnamed protein product [Adineta steineri]CAF1561064.1 unnamed protein product [Adineta steineri]CAF1664807.1 unnamed protein product [Adineta steineri]
MSYEWTSQPLSIQAIAAQYTLPVAIRSAPGFRGSSHPIILHSIARTTFGFGRALRVTQSTTKEYASYRPIDSELLAVPLKYPGYFECLPSRNNRQQIGIAPETNIRSIVEQMQIDHRPQAFYMVSPMRVYTVEANEEGIANRTWHQIEANQVILFDKLVHVEYTPTVNDDLTDEDYAFSWWFCLGKHILNRNEYALKCILMNQQVCYIPCSSTDEINLIPVGQRGSSNVNKLQAIHNLIEQFPMPLNIKLAQLPGSYAYKDFNGNLQLRGSRTEEFAVCASLSTSNIAAIPTNTPLKFVVAPLSSSSSQIRNILSSCQIFVQSFDMQIRRILVSTHHDTTSHRTRSRHPKIQAAIDDQFKRYKRSHSVEQNSTIKDDQTTTATTTDEGYRSGSSAAKKRQNYKQQRAASVDPGNQAQHVPRKRTLSTDDDTIYNSLVHPVRTKKESSSPPPPAVPKKPPNFPYPSTTFTYNSGSHLIEEINSADADGAILMDASNELFLALPSDSRFT